MPPQDGLWVSTIYLLVVMTAWGSDRKMGVSLFQITKSDGEKGVWVKTYSSWPLCSLAAGLLSKGAIIFGSESFEDIWVLGSSLVLFTSRSLDLESSAQQYQ